MSNPSSPAGGSLWDSADPLAPVTTGTRVVYAAVGAAWWGFLTYYAAAFFQPDWPLHFAVAAVGACVGACVGAVSHLWAARRWSRRQAVFGALAERLGFHAAPEVAAEIGPRIRELAGQGSEFEGVSPEFKTFKLRRTRVRSTADARLVLGEMDWRYPRTGGGEIVEYRRTVWYAEPHGADLPAFVLKPHAAARIKPLRTALAESVEFPARPAFARTYRLTADDPAAVRRLFTEEVLDFFEHHPGLEVLARGDRLAVFRTRDLVTAEGLPAFVETATRVTRLFAAAG